MSATAVDGAPIARRALAAVGAYAAWPAVVVGSIALVALGLRAGGHPTALALGTMVAGQLALAALERARPLRAAWRAGSDGQRAHDLGHYALSITLGNATALYATPILLGPLRAALARACGGAPPWPHGAPVALQLALALLLAELGLYAQHRAAHAWPWLWRFHAVHHEGARLDVLKATRQHAVDFATATFAALAPLVLLGAPAGLMLWLGVLSSALGLLQHANVDLRTPGWLDAWVCTPANHMLHHSRDLREGNLNFGVYLVVFDRLFGTYERPRTQAPPRVGLDGDPPPRSFARELFGELDAAHAATPASTVAAALSPTPCAPREP